MKTRLGVATLFFTAALAAIPGVSLAAAHRTFDARTEALMGDDDAHRLRFSKLATAEDAACDKASEGITVKLRDCAAKQFDRWDGRLNQSYRRKLASLAPKRRAALVASQRKWLRLRNPFCERVFQGGGTLELIVFDGCMVDVTIQRTFDVEGFR